jgi:hypothetical protein
LSFIGLSNTPLADFYAVPGIDHDIHDFNAGNFIKDFSGFIT